LSKTAGQLGLELLQRQISKLSRTFQTAFRNFRESLRLDATLAELKRLRIVPYEVIGKWLKSDDLATGTDRGQLSLQAGSDQNHQRPWWRLFERFEQAVGAFLIQPISIVDDGNASAATAGAQSNAVAQAFLRAVATVADQQFNGNHGFARRPRHHVDVRMGIGSDLQARVTLLTRIQLTLVVAIAQQALSQSQGERPFANAWGANKQVAARQPT
jgi:hypothetical protein